MAESRRERRSVRLGWIMLVFLYAGRRLIDDIGCRRSCDGKAAGKGLADDTAVTPQYVHWITAERMPTSNASRYRVGAQQAAAHPSGALLSQLASRGWATSSKDVGRHVLQCYEGAGGAASSAAVATTPRCRSPNASWWPGRSDRLNLPRRYLPSTRLTSHSCRASVVPSSSPPRHHRRGVRCRRCQCPGRRRPAVLTQTARPDSGSGSAGPGRGDAQTAGAVGGRDGSHALRAATVLVGSDWHALAAWFNT